MVKSPRNEFRTISGRRLLGFEILESRLVPATLTVINANDSGGGSLRNAIATAVDGDTIDFDASLDGAQINLASTLLVDKSLSIDANSLSNGIILDGDNGGTPIEIMSVDDGNGGSNSDVFLTRLTFQNGSFPSCGAIINLENTTATFCTFTNNSSPGDDGGAISNESPGVLNIIVCTFTGNTVTGGLSGGAIANFGSLNVVNTLFQNNSVDTTGNGGAIFNAMGATITNISGSNFVDNTAGASGGALYNQGQINSLQALFSGNDATTGDGGAIFNDMAFIFSLTGSQFNSNTALVNGGAISNAGAVSEILNTTFDQNVATTGTGGAIYNAAGVTIGSIGTSTFTDNTAFTSGGAIGNFGGFTSGGPSIFDSLFDGNMSNGSGGAIFNGVSGNFVSGIQSTTFANNVAGANGGAIANVGTVGYIQDATFSANQAVLGGAIYADGTINAFGNNTIAFNTAASSGGGVEVVTAGSIVAMVSNIISNNIAPMGADVNAVMGNSITFADYNLILDASGFSAATVGSNNIFGRDPILGSLQNNGGPTPTMAITSSSPAFNTGANPNSLLYDQRGPGFDRTVASATDIGAFEVQAGSLPLVYQVGTFLYGIFTANDDVADFTQLGNDSVSVVVNNVTFGPFTGVTHIYVYALAGNDLLRLDNKVTIPMTIDGGDGTDTLDFSRLADAVFTVIGSDPGTPSVFVALERIIGSQGDDYVLFKSDAQLSGFIDGQGGTNTLDFSRLGYPIELLLPSGPAPGSLQIANFDYGIGPLFMNNNIRPASANITNFLGKKPPAQNNNTMVL